MTEPKPPDPPKYPPLPDWSMPSGPIPSPPGWPPMPCPGGSTPLPDWSMPSGPISMPAARPPAEMPGQKPPAPPAPPAVTPPGPAASPPGGPSPERATEPAPGPPILPRPLEPLPRPQWPWPAPEPPRPAPVPRAIGRPNYRLHLILFVLTVVSTTLIGGPLYGSSIVAILLAHEMGHYLMARHHRVPATLPFFIPMPFSIFGTMGAVIRMANVGQDRKVLFDIGVAGPIAGLVLALPACLFGLSLSHVVKTTEVGAGHITLGSSLLFEWFEHLFFGNVPDGYDVMLHPIAFAGWAGLFVTALNLLPVGQLDGGHVVYALLGRQSRRLSLAVAVGFAALAIFVSPAWLLMAVLLLIFGIRHPSTADDSVPIDARRRLIGVLLMIVFVLSFTPKPFK